MACVYTPIEDNKTAAQILEGYRMAHKAMKIPVARPVVIKPRVSAPTPEQERRFMKRAHELLAFETLGVTSLPRVLAAVVMASETPESEIRSPRRVQHIMQARFAYYYVARTCTNASLPTIGRIVGGRDHTTVLSGVNTATAALANPECRISKIIRTAMQILEGSK